MTVLAASRAFLRCGLPPDTTHRALNEAINGFLAAAALDFGRGQEGGRLLEVSEHLALVKELEEIRQLFSVGRTGADNGEAAENMSSAWAGCWCKDIIVFAKYSKCATPITPSIPPCLQFIHVPQRMDRICKFYFSLFQLLMQLGMVALQAA